MNNIKIAITTGDTDGIGFEVAAKALNNIGPQKNIQFILWLEENPSRKLLTLIDRKFNNVSVHTLDEALRIDDASLIVIKSSISPAFWVEQTAKACMDGKMSAMVTGPLSKTCIAKAGLKDIGHTDILKRIAKVKSVHMGFIGSKFNVVLVTGHIPVSKIRRKITFESLSHALYQADVLRKTLNDSQKNRPIGILGLNPHAGEAGLIGIEEGDFYPKIVTFAKKHRIPIQGPLVPDAAFLQKNWRNYSVYLALYHDQGLIPFKIVHGQESGVHLSMGIPFIRTSVDHGTAKEIYGKNKANFNSMKEAILMAIKLARQA